MCHPAKCFVVNRLIMVICWSSLGYFLQCGRLGFDPWGEKIIWRRKLQPTSVFLPEKPRTEEPGGLQSMGSQRVRHDSKLLQNLGEVGGQCVLKAFKTG